MRYGLQAFGLKGLRAFIIEDSVSNQVLMDLVLKRIGLELHFASHKSRLSEEIDRFGTLDFFIIDFPDKGQGFETLELLRSLSDCAEVPVIAISEMPVDLISPLLKEKGCLGLVSKPLAFESFGRQLLGILKSEEFLHRLGAGK